MAVTDSIAASRRFLDQWRWAGLAGPLVDLVEPYLADDARLKAAAAALYVSQRDAKRARARGKDVEVPTGPDHNAGRRAALTDVVKQLRALGDVLLVDHLRPAHEQLLDDARELAPLIGDLASDAAALKPTTTTEAREAWVALARLHAERQRLDRLVRALVSDRIVPSWTVHEGGPDQAWRWFARPENGRAIGNAFIGRRNLSSYKAPPAARQMADLVVDEHGRRPGLYTADEVKANMRAADQEAHQAALGVEAVSRIPRVERPSPREREQALYDQQDANQRADDLHANRMRAREEAKPRKPNTSGLRSGANVPGV